MYVHLFLISFVIFLFETFKKLNIKEKLLKLIDLIKKLPTIIFDKNDSDKLKQKKILTSCRLIFKKSLYLLLLILLIFLIININENFYNFIFSLEGSIELVFVYFIYYLIRKYLYA
jgi:hypothetical protein